MTTVTIPMTTTLTLNNNSNGSHTSLKSTSSELRARSPCTRAGSVDWTGRKGASSVTTWRRSTSDRFTCAPTITATKCSSVETRKNTISWNTRANTRSTATSAAKDSSTNHTTRATSTYTGTRNRTRATNAAKDSAISPTTSATQKSAVPKETSSATCAIKRSLAAPTYRTTSSSTTRWGSPSTVLSATGSSTTHLLIIHTSRVITRKSFHEENFDGLLFFVGLRFLVSLVKERETIRQAPKTVTTLNILTNSSSNTKLWLIILFPTANNRPVTKKDTMAFSINGKGIQGIWWITEV